MIIIFLVPKNCRYVKARGGSVGRSELSRLEKQLRVLVTDLRGHMLSGIQHYIFQEDIDEKLMNVVEAGGWVWNLSPPPLNLI